VEKGEGIRDPVIIEFNTLVQNQLHELTRLKGVNEREG